MTRRSLVLGLGITGVAAAAYLSEIGDDVTIVDNAWTATIERRAEDMRVAGMRVIAGRDSASQTEAQAALAASELLVVSPGVPPTNPLLSAARNLRIPTWSEIELGFHATVAPIVAVTGTNGKTTVASMLGSIFEAAGIPTVVCGNVGVPMITVATGVPREGVVVVEVSSFQLLLTDAFHARCGVLLNIAQDHLDWHADMAEYQNSKARIWSNQTVDDLALANAMDPIVTEMVSRATGRIATFACDRLPQRGAGVSDGVLVAATDNGFVEVMAVDELGSTAPHDVANAAASIAVATDMDVPTDTIAEAIAGFERPPHRRENVATIDGVTFVNDSKATNPHATTAAVGSYDSIVLIAGGYNKGLDLSPIFAAVGGIRSVVAIGDAAPDIERLANEARLEVTRAHDMPTAVERSFEFAHVGDTVLLSPACASFDWYENYRERGTDFVRAVRDLERGRR